jgi:hypothetical protein
MLEDGGDGFGGVGGVGGGVGGVGGVGGGVGGVGGVSPGSFRSGGPIALGETAGALERLGYPLYRATEMAHVWLQPDYRFVLRAFNHYRHTRWIALLRFDPRPEWFDEIYEGAELVAVIRHDPEGRPFGFEPPPGVTASTNTFPHALYARHAEDVPRAALRYCAAWRKKPTT